MGVIPLYCWGVLKVTLNWYHAVRFCAVNIIKLRENVTKTCGVVCQVGLMKIIFMCHSYCFLPNIKLSQGSVTL